MEQKRWMKKSAAVVAATVLGISTSATAAFGADTYQSVEKAALAKQASEFAATYANSLKSTEILSPGVGADMTLTLDETGKAMLGSILGMDLSWASSVKMTMNASMEDGKEAALMDIYLNDTKICTMNTYIDMATGDTYVELPGLAEGYLKSNADESAKAMEEAQEAAQDAAEETGAEAELGEIANMTEAASSQQMMDFMNLFTKASETMPEASVVEDLINNYGGIIIGNTIDGEGAPETLTAEGVSQDCTVYEGKMTSKEADQMVTDILNTAKADEQLKTVIDTWSKALPDSEDMYQKFLDGIEKTLTDFEKNEVSEDDGTLISKVWVGEDGEIVGRQLSLDTAQEPLLTYQMPRKDGSYGYLLEVGAEGQTIGMNGSGTIADSKMNGTFDLTVSGTSFVSIEMTDYDTESMKGGYWNGSYVLTLQPGAAGGDEDTYNMMKDFSVTFDAKSEEESGDVKLGLNYAGDSLATLSTTSQKGEHVDYPDFSTAENVYDALDENAVTTYMEGFDYETLLANIKAAGVPEELINSFLGTGTEADAAAGTEADAAATDTETATEADAAA